METAKEKFNTIVAETNHYCKENNIDIDICKNLTLDNILLNWQKDIDKIKELEKTILNLQSENLELEENVNWFRNENILLENKLAESAKNLAKKISEMGKVFENNT